MPEGKETFNGIFQTFGSGNILFIEIIVPWILTGISFISFFECWRRDVITSSPDKNFFLAMFFGGFGFVESLEGSVMPFVKSPGFNYGYPQAIHFVESDPKGTQCPLKN